MTCERSQVRVLYRPPLSNIYGGKVYEGGSIKVFRGDEIKLSIKDTSGPDSCFPHEVFLGIWREEAEIAPETAVLESNWQAETTRPNDVFPPVDFWIFDTYSLSTGNYKIGAILKNGSMDRNKNYGSLDSMSIDSQIVPFRFINEWHLACGMTTDGNNTTCTKVEGRGKNTCKRDLDCETCDPSSCEGKCAVASIPGRVYVLVAK